MQKLITSGGLFVAVSLAIFGAEHLAEASAIMQVVPGWMPGRLFWVYLVGAALIAAAGSICLGIYTRLSGTLLGIMFLSFVLMIHLPNVVANPKNRILWVVALRDLAFAGGAFALASEGSRGLMNLGRILIAVPAVVFGVEQLLLPELVPGVPLAMATPAWIPFAAFWGYLTGAVLVVAGAAMLVNRRSRAAASAAGAFVTLMVVCIYLPILVAAPARANIEALNYFADTLLSGGTILLLSKSIAKMD